MMPAMLRFAVPGMQILDTMISAAMHVAQGSPDHRALHGGLWS